MSDSMNIKPSICGDNQIYAPGSGSCDECDRLAMEFEEAKEQAINAAADAQGLAETAQEAASRASEEASAAGVAMESTETYKTEVEALLEEARQILEQIRGAGLGKYSQTFTTTANQATFTFAPTGYTYAATDFYSVYVNGLKLTPQEFTKADNVITLNTPVSLAGQTVEVIAEVTED